MSLPLREIPTQDRPREKLLRGGPEGLSDSELVAILLRTGVRGRSAIDLAHDLLRHCEQKSPGAGLRYLLNLRDDDVKRVVKGIGDAKLAQLLAALQLGLRAGSAPLRRIDLSNPRAVFEYLSPRMSHLNHEQFQVLLVNAKNQLLDVEPVSSGTLTASLVHTREIFKAAIRRSAHAMILTHNHPSGDPTPSREDREVTLRMIEAGRILGIGILDHIVVGDGRYTSFRERGLAEFA